MSIIAGPFGPMAVHESTQYPFSIQYPANWTPGPVPLDGAEVAYFVGPQGESLEIAEEDTTAMRLGELTLKVYTDIALAAANSASFNYELVSREQTLTPQGLAAEVAEYTTLGGTLKSAKLFYLDENGIGFHATYLAPIDRYDELRELITHSFGMFRDGSAPPAPALTLTPGPESEDRRGAAVSISVDLPTTELEASTTVSFQITIKNEGSDSVVLVRIRSFLPPNFKFVPGSTGGDLTSRDPTILIGQQVCGARPEELIWSSIATRDIAAQEVRTLTFQATALLTNGTYSSQARLRYIPSWQKSHVLIDSPHGAEVTVGTGAPHCSYERES